MYQYSQPSISHHSDHIFFFKQTICMYAYVYSNMLTPRGNMTAIIQGFTFSLFYTDIDKRKLSRKEIGSIEELQLQTPRRDRPSPAGTEISNFIVLQLYLFYCIYRIFLRSFFNVLFNDALDIQALSQNCEKRLLASSCLSVRPHGTTQHPMDGFLLNLLFECFPKLCQENPRVIKICQK